MKLMLRLILVLMLAVSPAIGQTTKPITLKIGDPAPPLLGTKWVKGEPVKAFEAGKIYVIEMWATWCGPCVAAIPHVSKMQKEMEKDGVIVIGQNIWEDDASAVEPFVTKMGNDMAYRVVMDDVTGGSRGKMAEAWMDAAGRNGIPSSFVVARDGTIAWMGHPMEMEPILKQMIAGTFDAKKAAAEQEALDTFEQSLSVAFAEQQWDKALTLLDEFQKANPASSMVDQLETTRFNLLLQKKDYDAAYKLGATLAAKFNDNQEVLNNLAWTIADREGLEKRDLDLAEKMALRATELSKREDADILDTLARVYFEKGQIDKAIEAQTEAVNKAPAAMKQMLQSNLDRFRAGRGATQ